MAVEAMKRGNVLPADHAVEDTEEQGLQIDLVELFYRLLDKAWIIAIVGILAAILGGLFTYFFVEESYTATTKLYVIGENTTIDLTQLNFGDKLAEDYVEVFRNRDVHSSVQAYLARDGFELPSYEQVKRSMTVTQLSNTRILSISYTSGNRDDAFKVVEAYAQAAISFISSKMGAERPPTEFEKPYVARNSIHLVRNTILAMLLGVFAVIGVLTVQFVVDDRIHTSEQLEQRLGIPTLGMMPIQEQESKSRKRRKGAKA